jgi:hypothetical protein
MEKFISGLSVEDVEGISQNVLDMQADDIKKYYDKWTEEYKKNKGKLPVDKLLEIQKEKAALLRNQKRWQMSQKNYQDQALNFVKYPDRYDPYETQENLKGSFDPEDPTKNYLVSKYIPTTESIADLMKNEKLNETFSEERLDPKTGKQITETMTTSEVLSEEKLPELMRSHFEASPTGIQRSVVREMKADARDFQKILEEKGENPDDPDVKMANEWMNRYANKDGALQYFMDNYKDDYQRYTTKKTAVNLPPRGPKEKEKPIIIPEDRVSESGETMKVWNTATDAVSYDQTPSEMFEEKGGVLAQTTAKPISGKIVQVVSRKSPGISKPQLFAVVQHRESVPSEFNYISGVEKGSGSKVTTAYIPFRDLSTELRGKLDYQDIDQYVDAANKSTQDLFKKKLGK